MLLCMITLDTLMSLSEIHVVHTRVGEDVEERAFGEARPEGEAGRGAAGRRSSLPLCFWVTLLLFAVFRCLF